MKELTEQQIKASEQSQVQFKNETGNEALCVPVCHGELAFASWEYQLWLEEKAASLSRQPSAATEEGKEWISVEDDLPDFDELVLWVREDGLMFIDDIDHDNTWENFSNVMETSFTGHKVRITHWRKLPEIPLNLTAEN